MTNVVKNGAKQLKLDHMVAVKTTSNGKLSAEEEDSPELKKKVPSKLKAKDNLETKSISTKTSSSKSDAVSNGAAAVSTTKTIATSPQKVSLYDQINFKRFELYESIAAFSFNKKRVRVLTEVKEFPENSNGILYWMSREQRIQDNWALLYAQKLALKQNMPLYVCFCMVPTFLNATYRHYYFMLEGLKEVKQVGFKIKILFFNLKLQYIDY
jgi:deoxyribodipyrimidine photo-lyase